jgi:hypothetical protein
MPATPKPLPQDLIMLIDQGEIPRFRFVEARHRWC